MAIAEVNFFSESLLRTTTIYCIIPSDKKYYDGKHHPVKPFKTLYLLHGIFGDYTDWLYGTRIQRWAQDRNLAVIMPSGENKFYVDNEKSLDNGSKFIEELVLATRDMFRLSEKREDTFIAGLSMGGYGAIINGLKYSDLFGKVIGLSAALNQDLYQNMDDSNPMPIFRKSYIESVFGDLDKIPGSDKDYNALAEKLARSGKELPEIYLTCGVDDDLIIPNRKYRDFLKSLGYEVTWKEKPGAHEWDFWDGAILDVLEWLPLDQPDQGISSGNVDTTSR